MRHAFGPWVAWCTKHLPRVIEGIEGPNMEPLKCDDDMAIIAKLDGKLNSPRGYLISFPRRVQPMWNWLKSVKVRSKIDPEELKSCKQATPTLQRPSRLPHIKKIGSLD